MTTTSKLHWHQFLSRSKARTRSEIFHSVQIFPIDRLAQKFRCTLDIANVHVLGPRSQTHKLGNFFPPTISIYYAPEIRTMNNITVKLTSMRWAQADIHHDYGPFVSVQEQLGERR